jgi:hypothetical protein
MKKVLVVLASLFLYSLTLCAQELNPESTKVLAQYSRGKLASLYNIDYMSRTEGGCESKRWSGLVTSFKRVDKELVWFSLKINQKDEITINVLLDNMLQNERQHLKDLLFKGNKVRADVFICGASGHFVSLDAIKSISKRAVPSRASLYPPDTKQPIDIWTYLTSGADGADIYYAPSRVVKMRGSLMRAWIKTVEPEANKTKSHSIELDEFDCHQERFRIIQETKYYRSGEGNTSARPSVWFFVTPGTVFEHVLSVVCKHR